MDIDDKGFDEGQWRKLVVSGHERYLNNEDHPPHLHDEWLTEREIAFREKERKRRWFNQKEKKVKDQFKDDEEIDKPILIKEELESEPEEIGDDDSVNSELSLVDEGAISSDKGIGTLKEVRWKNDSEGETWRETLEESTSGPRRSTRVKTPIKRLLNEQTLYNEAIGPRREGKCLKSSKDILQEAHDQRVNVGYYNMKTTTKTSGSKTKRSRIASKNVMSLNTLK